jgi:hypothetical protein
MNYPFLQVSFRIEEPSNTSIYLLTPAMGKRASSSKSDAKESKTDDTRLLASGFITAMKAPSSSKEQKSALEYYQSLPRFSDLKKEILLKWKHDKSCQWFQSYKETHCKKVENVDERAQGYGTVSGPQ